MRYYIAREGSIGPWEPATKAEYDSEIGVVWPTYDEEGYECRLRIITDDAAVAQAAELILSDWGY
jgi:hypothetical protein